MIQKLDIKKDLTNDQFDKVIISCKEYFKSVNNFSELASSCHNKTKEITPSMESHLMLPQLNTNEFYVIDLDKKIPLTTEENSILSECYNRKQPLIVNDVKKSFLYNEKHDNFIGCEIKDILVMPILSKDRDVLAILWAATTRKRLNQYTQKHIDRMSKLSVYIKNFIEGKTAISSLYTKELEDSLTDCKDTYNNLNAKIRREQEYFSAIIHDIRSPMNGVLGFLELLQHNETDPSKKEYIEIALKSGESMVALINDALDISKMSSGKMSIERVPFCIFDELSDVTKLYHNSAKQKGIKLSVFYDLDIPKTINSDYHRIKQIMGNLLNNAIKFTPRGGKIDVELLYNKELDGLDISIQDNGIGISKDMHENIFNPYRQEKSSTSREYGGTGLGLSISQQLSVLLGGKIELESEDGKGSKFSISVPCNSENPTEVSIDKNILSALSVVVYDSFNSDKTVTIVKQYLEKFAVNVKYSDKNKLLKNMVDDKFDILLILREDMILHEEYIQMMLDANKSVIIIEEDFADHGDNWFVGNLCTVNTPILPHSLFDKLVELTVEDTSKKAKITKNINYIKNKKVLVVDDNIINLKLMREILKVLKAKSTLANSAEEGIEEFNAMEFDIIFMDENMPSMQGTDAIKYMRNEYNCKHIETRPIIIGLTGSADKETKDRLMDAGADAVLTKPVQIKDIVKVCEELFCTSE